MADKQVRGPIMLWGVGSGAILRHHGQILLGRRIGTGFADALYGAPSGHLEDGEAGRRPHRPVLRDARDLPTVGVSRRVGLADAVIR